MSVIDQKEYLKKYLGIGKRSGEKKKKKKKPKNVVSHGLKIVDDDMDVRLNEEIKEDLAAANEEAPQIVSIIDDRPPSLRIDEVTKEKLWTPLGGPDEPPLSARRQPSEDNSPTRIDSDSSPPRRRNHGQETSFSIKRQHGDSSPPRKKKQDKKDVGHEVRRQREPSEDNSPKRRVEDSFPPRKKKHDKRDLGHEVQIKIEPSEDNSPKRQDSDSSPPRKRTSFRDNEIRVKREPSEDNSPPRRRKHNKDRRDMEGEDRDSSPPRRRNHGPGSSSRGEEIRIKREPSEDNTPPRRRKHDKDRRDVVGEDRDSSPPRRRNHGPGSSSRGEEIRIKREPSEDNSPPRRRKHDKDRRDVGEPSKRRDNDSSPPRKKKHSRWEDSEKSGEKLTKTLDGKKAGIQKAADMIEEMKKLKQKEDDMFKNMSAEVSGKNATTTVRFKKKEVDVEEEEKKKKREQENKEKYDRWGKGLKQVQDVYEKLQSDLHEMNKPLARYADDEDLEKYLKSQEREGDPMLAYLRKKKKKKAVKEGIPDKPQYRGDAPANRFGIRPGYRWDGVDRSNGYEKEWFQIQNSRTANVEESYKWSTEDM